jgi:hypothetical protein
METLKCYCGRQDKNLFSKTASGQYKKYCDPCINAARIKYEDKKNKKICISCGERSQENRAHCKACLIKVKKAQTIKRAKARAEGKCITCAINPAERGPRCFKCIAKHNLPLKTKIFRSARSRAKKANLEFNITEDDIIIPEFCPILGLKLCENVICAKPNSFSLDRIDSRKGYIKGNIHIISHRANAIKNDATIEELEKIVLYLKNI